MPYQKYLDIFGCQTLVEYVHNVVNSTFGYSAFTQVTLLETSLLKSITLTHSKVTIFCVKIVSTPFFLNTSRLICLHLFDILNLIQCHSGIFKCDLRDQMLFGGHCVLEFSLTVTEEAK